MNVPDDPRIDAMGDSGYCAECGEHLDSGRCECHLCVYCGKELENDSCPKCDSETQSEGEFYKRQLEGEL